MKKTLLLVTIATMILFVSQTFIKNVEGTEPAKVEKSDSNNEKKDKSMNKENEIESIQKKIIRDIIRLKEKFPHFKNLKDDGSNYIFYENGMKYVPNPDYEKELKAYQKETKNKEKNYSVKRRIAYGFLRKPDKEIKKYNDYDGIYLSVNFSSISQMALQFLGGSIFGAEDIDLKAYHWNDIARIGPLEIHIKIEGGKDTQEIYDSIVRIIRKHNFEFNKMDAVMNYYLSSSYETSVLINDKKIELKPYNPQEPSTIYLFKENSPIQQLNASTKITRLYLPMSIPLPGRQFILKEGDNKIVINYKSIAHKDSDEIGVDLRLLVPNYDAPIFSLEVKSKDSGTIEKVIKIEKNYPADFKPIVIEE